MIKQRITIYVLTCMFAAACAADVKIPDGITIACTTAGDCPQDLVCGLNIGRCVLPTEESIPTLSSMSLSMNAVKVSDRVNISATFAGTVAVRPTCSIMQQEQAFPCAAGDFRADTGVFVSSYEVTGKETEGIGQVRFSLGTTMQAVVIDGDSELLFDFSAPGMPTTFSITPSAPALNDIVEFRFVPTEPLAGLPQVRCVEARTASTYRMMGGVNNQTNEYVFNRVISPDMPAGRYTISLSAQEDLVGNIADSMSVGTFSIE